jgi:hypothetical protein
MNMPKEFYRTGRVNVDHRTYGGELSLFDFEGHHTMSSMANRIAADSRFNNMCKQSTLNKERLMKYDN